MKQNVFEDLRNRKEQLKNLITKAVELGWIDEKQQKGLIQRLDKNKITLGVIGQMKCGKSTFLNSFVFGKEILPAATTPMTAALSVITYGEEKKLLVEFYSLEEWAALRNDAETPLESVVGNEGRISKIKAAKDLVEKSEKLGSEIDALLGTKKEDDFNKLEDYVGADGRYTPITKSVTIYLNEEYLKGVEIVDTPGFNDPVVSREQRTQDFLKEADVALMIVSAGRPFDSTDRDIIFNKLLKVGIGKFILGINKYDLQIEAESEEDMIEYVKKEYKKACYYNNVTETEFVNIEPILFSAQMALLGKMPIDDVLNHPDKKIHYNKALELFDISSQKEVLEKSLIKAMDEAVKEVLLGSKIEIISNKIKREILAIGERQQQGLEEKMSLCNEKIKSLEYDPDELDEKITELNRAKRKIDREIDYQIGEAEHSLYTLIRKKRDEVSEFLLDKEREFKDFIENSGRKDVENHFETKQKRFNMEFEGELLNDTSKKTTKILEQTFGDIISETVIIFNKYIEDFDSRRLEQKLRKTLRDIVDEYTWSKEKEKVTKDSNIVDDILERAGVAMLIAIGTAISAPFEFVDDRLGGWKEEYKKNVGEQFAKFNKEFPKIIEHLEKETKRGMNVFEKEAKDILIPIIEILDEVKNSKEDKDKAIEKVQNETKELYQKIEIVTAQIREMKTECEL